MAAWCAIPAAPAAYKSAPVNTPSAPVPRNRFPLWTMGTGRDVIEGHSGIYSPELWQFLTRLADPGIDGDNLCL